MSGTGTYSGDLYGKWTWTLKSEIDYLTRRLGRMNTQHRASMRKRERIAKRIRAKQAKLVTMKLEQ